MNTLDQIVNALGPPQAFREIKIPSSSRSQAAVARWRHQGAFINLSGSDDYQLVFNISGGQVVELYSEETIIRRSIRAGSVAIVYPNHPESVKIHGEADALHFFMTRELIESVTGGLKPATLPRLVSCEPQLQAAAAQALVALSQGERHSVIELDAIVVRIASQFAQPDVLPSNFSHGGLSPGARRRVCALINDQLGDASCSRLSLGELATAANLSVHHFIKAFRRSEGATPYARVTARRINKALTLLLRADARVDQIAEETGFSSPSHFVSTFRKRVGVTPGALRDAAQLPVRE